MKNICAIIFLTIFLVGCDGAMSKDTPKEQNLLVLQCSNEYPEDVVFIWEQTSNSLKRNATYGIPYKSNDQFEIIFEKIPPEISGATPKETYKFKEYVIG